MVSCLLFTAALHQVTNKPEVQRTAFGQFKIDQHQLMGAYIVQ